MTSQAVQGMWICMGVCRQFKGESVKEKLKAAVKGTSPWLEQMGYITLNVACIAGYGI